ncbi:zinc-ribbon domain-containing protein [Sorangium sp. So ce296]|uniref:zinc-ribbon domain-containing protein n=1 Tax=Sorangium sp. So ce296 TaxID=3133296 RepID=UPI003F5FFD69
MKITCESCQAKYTIADEKVVGKTVKIKCKKCNHAMVVHGASEAASAPSQDATVGQQGDLAEDADAKLVADAGGAPSTAAADEWTVNVAEGDERTMTTAQLVTEYGRGALSNDTYVWKEGMSDWLPIASVPELKERFSSRDDAAPAADAAAAAVATPAPAAAAAPAAVPAPAATPAPAPAAVPAAAAVPTPAAVPAAAAAPVPVAPAPAGLRFGPEGTVVMKEAKRAPVPAASAGAAAAASAGAAAAASAGAAAAASAGAAAVAPAADGGAAAGAPAAAAPATAARRPGRGAAVDVFSAAAAERATEPAPSAPPPGGDRQVGERNENSVLFSLSALTATENAAKEKQEETPAGRRLSSRPAKNNGRTGYDDLLNLGGGAIASAPMLAPPPLLAPVTDSRPPPSLSASAKSSVPPPPLLPLSPMAAPEPAAKKGRLGVIAAAVAAVVLIGGVAFFFMQSPKEDTSTTTPEQTNAAPAEAPSPAATPEPAPTPTETAAAATPPPAETAAPAAEEPAASAAAPDQPAPSAAAEKPADKGRPSSAPAPAAAADKPAAPKPAAEPAPSGGGGEFNRGAASSALGAAAGSAKSCKKAGGPTGTGKVKVTFAPSGNVTSAEVQGAPFAGTSVGGCVARLFRGARVPAFGGGPVSVSKSFTIN